MDRNSVIESIILVDFFFFFFLKTNLGRISRIKIIPSEKRERKGKESFIDKKKN